MKEKQIKALRRKARQLGLEVVEKMSGQRLRWQAAVPVEGDKGGEEGIRSGGSESAGKARGDRGRTTSQTGQWLWQERVPRKTRAQDHLGAPGKLSGGGSL